MQFQVLKEPERSVATAQSRDSMRPRGFDGLWKGVRPGARELSPSYRVAFVSAHILRQLMLTDARVSDLSDFVRGDLASA